MDDMSEPPPYQPDEALITDLEKGLGDVKPRSNCGIWG